MGNQDGDKDGGVDHGAALVSYAEAVHAKDDVVATLTRLRDAVGSEGALEAAVTCAAFNGLVRVADGIGIQLDDGTEVAVREARGLLGIDDFGGSANTVVSQNPSVGADVSAIEGDVVRLFTSAG